MHPEMSLVVLTVLAGAGQGLFVFLVLFDAILLSSGVPSGFVYGSGILSVVLTMIGMGASFFHLGNPAIGYKAMKMVRSSWLSREVVFLPLFLALVVGYMALYYIDAPASYRLAVGLAGVAASIGAYVSSAMLYAAISFIREWANPYTVINFLLFGLTSGAALSLAVIHHVPFDTDIRELFTWFIVAAGLLSLVSKALAFRFNATVYQPIGIKNALGINDPNIKLMDMGVSYEHYNTTEYHYPIKRHVNTILQTTVLLVAFLIPVLILVFLANDSPDLSHPVISSVAAALMIAGLVVERRLFFIQGNHIQNIYYGNLKVKDVRNPILSRSRATHPAP